MFSATKPNYSIKPTAAAPAYFRCSPDIGTESAHEGEISYMTTRRTPIDRPSRKSRINAVAFADG